MLEQTMDRQKLSRMMERSERMYLLDKRRRQKKVRVSAIDASERGGVKTPTLRLQEYRYLHSTA